MGAGVPDVTTIVIVGGVWMAVVLVAISLAVAAGRSDAAPERFADDPGPRPWPRGEPGPSPWLEPGPSPQLAPAVANVGNLRARLRAAATIVDAEQVVVAADIGGREAVLATSRTVVLIDDAERPTISVPVTRGGREVATLRAVRAPGDMPFGEADRQLLTMLAARMAEHVDVADPSWGAERARHIDGGHRRTG